jgi:predicted kinase
MPAQAAGTSSPAVFSDAAKFLSMGFVLSIVEVYSDAGMRNCPSRNACRETYLCPAVIPWSVRQGASRGTRSEIQANIIDALTVRNLMKKGW